MKKKRQLSLAAPFGEVARRFIAPRRRGRLNIPDTRCSRMNHHPGHRIVSAVVIAMREARDRFSPCVRATASPERTSTLEGLPFGPSIPMATGVRNWRCGSFTPPDRFELGYVEQL